MKRELKKSFIFCMTPLQVLIAERIIEMNPNEDFYGWVICPKKINEKYYRALYKLEKKCKKLEHICLEGKLTYLFALIKFYCKFLFAKNIGKVYLSSIDNIFCQMILSLLNKVEIYTFDDGTANLDTNSFFYRLHPKSIKYKWIRRVFRIKYDIFDIRKLSVCHYTIYKDASNITNKKKFISLLPNNIQENKSSNIVKIFLGQPVWQISQDMSETEQRDRNQKNTRIIEQAIEACKANFYFPHPRETYKIKNVQYIETPLIFEEYLIEQLRKNPNRSYKIYTFFSTAGLNVISLPNVRVVSLRNNSIPKKWDNIYNLLIKMNIKVENF